LDSAGLYLDPRSKAWNNLQGADADGDTGLVYGLKQDTEFGRIMQRVLTASNAEYEKYLESLRAQGLSEERIKEIADKRTKGLGEGRTYNALNGADVAEYIDWATLATPGMGYADAVNKNAHQFRMTDRVARALAFGQEDYDAISVGGKKAQTFEHTDDERWAVGQG